MKKTLRGVFILLGILISSANGSEESLLGSRRCSWGPSYWCQNLAQSAECSATTHCINQAWSQAELPKDDDEVCTICKKMVGEARDTLLSNETQMELKEVFEGSCKLIPVKIIADECIRVFDEFVPELVETLASEMNPQVVCAVAGLCNSARIDDLLKSHYSQNPPSFCQTCRSGMRKFVQEIRETEPSDILLRLLDLCGEFSSYSDSCKVTVIEMFDETLKVLKEDLNEEMCDFVGICSATHENKKLVPSEQSQDLECEFCEKIIQHWKEEWSTNTTEEEFKKVLDALCHKLSDQSRTKRCLHIVDDYYIPIFKYLTQELDPQIVCQLFGLCKNNVGSFVKISDDSSVFTLLLPEENISPVPTFNSVTSQPSDTKVKTFNARKTGPLIATFNPYLNNQESIPSFPLTTSERVISETHLVDLIPTIDTESDFHQVDTFPASNLAKDHEDNPSVNFQSSMQWEEIYTSAVFAPDIFSTPLEPATYHESQLQNGPTNCVICFSILDKLVEIIDEDRSLSTVQEAMDSICEAIHHDIRDECSDFIGVHGPVIQRFLIEGGDQGDICTLLGLCTDEIIPPPTEEVKSIQCKICTIAMKILDKNIKNKKSEQEIRHQLGKLCSAFPKLLRRECKKFVSRYTDKIVDAILKGLKPKQVCHKLHLCTVTQVPIVETINSHGGGCVLCEYIIKELDKILNDNKNRDKIRDGLNKVCESIPSAEMKKECHNFIKEYVDAILDAFTHGASPEEICQILYLCNAGERIPPVEIVPIQKKSDSACQTCEIIFTEVFDDILNNKDKMKEALNDVCRALFSGPEAESCESMTDHYIDEIISNMQRYDSPEKLCKLFYVCDGPEEKARHPNEIPPLELAHDSGSFCSDCVKVLDQLEHSALTNTSLDFVTRALQMVCSYFPNPEDTKCERMIDKLEDKILKFISNNPPLSICKTLKLCMSSSLYNPSSETWNAQILGGKECSWGPSYWCKSLSHARICGTIDHCRRNVWI